MVLYLLRYSEIGLKSDPVRSRFEHMLASNIENMFIQREAECKVTSDRGHLYVKAEDDHVASSVLGRTFGLVSFSPVDVIETDQDVISRHVAELSRSMLKDGQSFAIRSRRTGDHCFTSREMAIRAGDAVREANEDRKVKVDLEEPDLELHIEVRWNKTYVYTTKLDGPGGLPFGSQGMVVAPIRDMDDALACWLMMKRGCRPFICPIGPKGGAQYEAVAMLGSWAPTGKLARGPDFKELTEDRLEILIDFAWMKRANAIVVGNKDEIFEKRDFPVFYPLIGLDDELRQRFERLMGSGG